MNARPDWMTGAEWRKARAVARQTARRRQRRMVAAYYAGREDERGWAVAQLSFEPRWKGAEARMHRGGVLSAHRAAEDFDRADARRGNA